MPTSRLGAGRHCGIDELFAYGLARPAPCPLPTLRKLVQQFRLSHRLPDLRATVGAFVGEVDLRHAPMRCDVLDVHRQARTAWADHEGWFGVVMVDIGWHVGSPTRHSAVVPDPEARWCSETANRTLTAFYARVGLPWVRDDACAAKRSRCSASFRETRLAKATSEAFRCRCVFEW